LIVRGIEIDRRGRRVEYTGGAEAEDAEHDRAQDEAANDKLVREPTGRSPLLLLALPLALLFLAPLTAQLGGHT
jgi:hypothetical protein